MNNNSGNNWDNSGNNWDNNGNNWGNNGNNWDNNGDNDESEEFWVDTLLDAIADDNTDTVEEIINQHQNFGVDDTDIGGEDIPLLSYALGRYTSPKSAELLLRHGANPNRYFNYPSWGLITPLMYAAVEEMNPSAVRLLLKSGADPSLKSRGEYRRTAYEMIEENQLESNNSNTRSVAQQIARMLKRPVSRRALRRTKRALKPHVRNIIGSLSVRGRLPANIVRGKVLPFLGLNATKKGRNSSKKSKK